jgi:hypothetical protein
MVCRPPLSAKLPAAPVTVTVVGQLDAAEVVVQVFDTPDPVGGAKADFAADARQPNRSDPAVSSC